MLNAVEPLGRPEHPRAARSSARTLRRSASLSRAITGDASFRFSPETSSLRTETGGRAGRRVRSPPATARIFVSVVYDRAAGNAFLCGFESSERWWGRVEIDAAGPGAAAWKIGFDGGDLQVAPGEEIDLESIVLRAGPDPLALLETYADDVARPHVAGGPRAAGILVQLVPIPPGGDRGPDGRDRPHGGPRLKPLGLRVIEADLGWEAGGELRAPMRTTRVSPRP